MKKIIASVLTTVLLLSTIMVAYADNNSDHTITSVTGIEITQSEYDLAEKTATFYKNHSVNTQHPSTGRKMSNSDPILENLINRKIIESLFVEKQVELTSEETAYVDTYCAKTSAIINDMLENGDIEEQENARAVLKIREEERKYCGLTQSEAEAIETAEVAYCIKYDKLLNLHFNGSLDELLAYLQNITMQ